MKVSSTPSTPTASLATALFACATLATTACATTPAPVPGSPQKRDRCTFVRIEQDHASSEVGAYDQADYPVRSSAFTLTVRPSGGTETVNAKVVVRDEQADDLEARLQQQPDLLCEPEPGGSGLYRVTLP